MTNNRAIGWTLAGVGMLLMSTDSLFIRLSGASDWDIAFIVAAFSLPSQLILNRVFGKGGVVQSFRAHPRPMLLAASLALCSQLAFIAAINRTEVANAVVVIGAAPVLAAFAGWILLKERTDRRTWIAIALSMVGILIVVSGSLGRASLAGDLLALLAITIFSINFTVWRRFPEMNRFVGLGLSALMTLVITAPLADPFSHDSSVYIPLALMGLFFNPIGRVCLVSAPRFISSAETALFVPVETVTASAWAWLAFSEIPSGRTVAGGVVVLTAVLWGTFGRLIGPSFGARGARSRI